MYGQTKSLEHDPIQKIADKYVEENNPYGPFKPLREQTNKSKTKEIPMKLLAIDGNSIMNRAFYGIKALSNSKGQFMSIIEITYEKNPGHPDLENDSLPASDNPERKTRRGKSASDNQPQYNTNNIKTKDNTKNTIINHSIQNERNKDNPQSSSLVDATKRRVNYDLMLKTLSISELTYAERIITLISAYISNEQLKSSLKISGQYVQPDQAIFYFNDTATTEIYTVSKNMANAQIPLDKPDSYYFSALEKQYQINNPDGEEFNDYFFDN